jgi:polyhydroxybutyrate depolymerase
MKNKLLLFFALLGSVQAHAGLQRALPLQVDKLTRQYDLYIPDRPAGKARPLVILYHGHMGDSDVMTGENHRHAPYKVWLQLAQRNNFIVAVPNGEKGSDGYRGWNDCRADTTTNPATDDVKFTLRLIDAINRRTPVDRHRIYATGTSNGGNMVIRLAMEVPQKFAALAAVVASNPVKNKCKETHQPISILFMNGTADPILPYQGGKVGKEKSGRGVALSTQDTVQYWLKIDQIKAQPLVHQFPDSDRRDDSTVTRYIYKSAQAGPQVVLYEVKGGGHTEPSHQEQYRWLYKLIVGKQNHDIEMAKQVWAFFKDKKR